MVIMTGCSAHRELTTDKKESTAVQTVESRVINFNGTEKVVEDITYFPIWDTLPSIPLLLDTLRYSEPKRLRMDGVVKVHREITRTNNSNEVVRVNKDSTSEKHEKSKNSIDTKGFWDSVKWYCFGALALALLALYLGKKFKFI